MKALALVAVVALATGSLLAQEPAPVNPKFKEALQKGDAERSEERRVGKECH